MHIHKYDLVDILPKLPNLEEFSDNMDFDVLICSLGFEERTYNIVEHLNKDEQLLNKDLILITYPTNVEENNLNVDKFENKRGILNSLEFLEYNKVSFYNDLKKVIRSKVGDLNKTVLFDISTSSSYIIYPALKVFFDLDIELVIGYSEAEFYYPTYEEWHDVELKASLENNMFPQSYEDAKFLIKGVEDVYSSNLFSEMNPGNNPSVLIAIPNFTKIRMNSVVEKDRDLNKTNSENIIWMLGEPPSSEKRWRLEALEKIYNIQNVTSSNKVTVSTLYYKDIIEKLEEIWISYNYSFHITIGNLGSKMQHLGAFLFWILHPDIGFLVTEPTEFKSKFYSNGFGAIHQIKFGSTKKLNETFSQYLKFKLDENFPRKS